MYVINLPVNRHEPSEIEIVVDVDEIVEHILDSLRDGSMEPDIATKIPETISLIDTVSEKEYELYWEQEVRKDLSEALKNMWDDLTIIWAYNSDDVYFRELDEYQALFEKRDY